MAAAPLDGCSRGGAGAATPTVGLRALGGRGSRRGRHPVGSPGDRPGGSHGISVELRTIRTCEAWSPSVRWTIIPSSRRPGVDKMCGIPSGVVGRLEARYARTRSARSAKPAASTGSSQAPATPSRASATSASNVKPVALFGDLTGRPESYVSLPVPCRDSRSCPRSGHLGHGGPGRDVIPSPAPERRRGCTSSPLFPDRHGGSPWATAGPTNIMNLFSGIIFDNFVEVAVNCRSMRRRLGTSGAVVVISAVGVIGAAYAEAPAGAAAIRGPQAHGRQGGLCVIALPQGVARKSGNWSAEGGSPPIAPPTRSRPASGDVSVTIPSTVFIRVGRKRIVVTTNTGVPPVSSDEFWVLAHGSASPADASMRAEVLTGCTSSPKHGSGSASMHGSSPLGPRRATGTSTAPSGRHDPPG